MFLEELEEKEDAMGHQVFQAMVVQEEKVSQELMDKKVIESILLKFI